MSKISIKRILERMGRNHFYLLELRHSDDHTNEAHEKLWSFAKAKKRSVNYSRNTIYGMSTGFYRFKRLRREEARKALTDTKFLEAMNYCLFEYLDALSSIPGYRWC